MQVVPNILRCMKDNLMTLAFNVLGGHEALKQAVVFKPTPNCALGLGLVGSKCKGKTLLTIDQIVPDGTLAHLVLSKGELDWQSMVSRVMTVRQQPWRLGYAKKNLSFLCSPLHLLQHGHNAEYDTPNGRELQ